MSEKNTPSKGLSLKEARRLYKMGFAIHWLHPRSKRPIEKGWGSGPRHEWDYLKETYMEGLNVGVRLGQPSKVAEKFLAVVDVDIKSKDKRHRDEALKAVVAIIGVENYRSCPQVRSGRGNGSRHYYCLTNESFKTFNPAQSKEIIKVHMPSKKPSKKEVAELTPEEINQGIRLSHAWEISLYSDGRQVVLPPSIHPDSGEPYHWKTVLTDVSELPAISFDGFKSIERQGEESDREAIQTSERSEEATLNFTVEPVDLGWLPISDRVRDGIIDGKDVEDRSGFLLQASSALFSAGLNQNEVLTVLTDPNTFLGAVGYDHAKTKNRQRAAEWVYRYTVKKVAQERSAEFAFSKAGDMKPEKKLTPEEMEAQTEELLSEVTWKQKLDKGGKKVTLKNLDLIFTHATESGTPFKKDLFANRIAYGADTPWGGKDGQYIEDIDMILVKRWFADTEFNIEPSTNAILEATSLVAHRLREHPVREWLHSLKWDGVPRIDTWIKDYCEGDAPEPYLSQVSRKFLLALVKRVMEPGCQWDYVLVLEGQQGKYKSSIARALVGDKWFMDNLPDLKDKDAMLNLQGKWLIELGELTNVKRADYNLVKAYLVRRTDTVRPHYGRLMADVPRQSVFIGTVNEGEYLKDPTGNRRFWPVKVGMCDVPSLKKVRDQLFAEAFHVYKTTGEVLMLDAEANVQATEAQEDRRVDDDETEMREALLDFMKSEHAKEFDWENFKARDLFGGPSAPWGRWQDKGYVLNTAAQVLRNLGFSRTKVEGQRIWRKSKLNVFETGHPSKGEVPRMPRKMIEYDFM